MKKVNFLLFFFLLISLTACKQEKEVVEEEKNPLAHTMPTMVDVVGSYEGDLPCENCDKEMVKLKFLMDKTAFQSIARVNGDGSTAGFGTWDLVGEKVTVNISGNNNEFTIKGNQLQKEVEGKTYILKKIEE